MEVAWTIQIHPGQKGEYLLISDLRLVSVYRLLKRCLNYKDFIVPEKETLSTLQIQTNA